MRRPLLGLAVLSVISLLAPANRSYAQLTSGSVDPFSLYYGYYLPQQAALAAQATPLDTINAAIAGRIPVVADRAALYDPNSPFAEEDFDILHPYSSRRGRERVPRPHVFPTNTTYARVGRLGQATIYFNRTSRYYSTLKSGQHANQNLAVTRRSRGGGGGMGMPGLPAHVDRGFGPAAAEREPVAIAGSRRGSTLSVV